MTRPIDTLIREASSEIAGLRAELARAKATIDKLEGDNVFWRDSASAAGREVLRLMEEAKVLHSRIETQATAVRDAQEDRDFWRSCASERTT